MLQAVENKNIIASDEFLTTLLETIKEGVLNCKIVCKDGKRSSDRSWRPAWAVLKKSGALFLCKEKKDNIMIPSVDSYPINLKNSHIDIAYDYTKRKNVFKVNTFSNSEYLFQTIDHESMLEWIKAMQENSEPPDLEKLMQQAKQYSPTYNKSLLNQTVPSKSWLTQNTTTNNNNNSSFNEQPVKNYTSVSSSNIQQGDTTQKNKLTSSSTEMSSSNTIRPSDYKNIINSNESSPSDDFSPNTINSNTTKSNTSFNNLSPNHHHTHKSLYFFMT